LKIKSLCIHNPIYIQIVNHHVSGLTAKLLTMRHTIPYTYSPLQSYHHFHNLAELGTYNAFPQRDHLDAQAISVVVIQPNGTHKNCTTQSM
jgi:hypothetical protein